MSNMPRQTEPEYQSGLLCDEWEVVVPELVFEPEVIRPIGMQRPRES